MIHFDRIRIRQGAFELREVSFQIPAGSYAVLMGKTGCGKTTLLEILCGLRKPAGGRVLLDGRDATRDAPGARQIGYVPQDQALFPHLTVGENIAFPLEIRRWKAAERRERVRRLAEHLHLEPLLDRYPAHLSGGEAQRTALGRALAARPRILCLDEPLSALDEETHLDMMDLLRGIHQGEAPTLLHITHRATEAAALATLTLRIDAGRVELNPLKESAGEG